MGCAGKFCLGFFSGFLRVDYRSEVCNSDNSLDKYMVYQRSSGVASLN
jgi:hypothetical protein